MARSDPVRQQLRRSWVALLCVVGVLGIGVAGVVLYARGGSARTLFVTGFAGSAERIGSGSVVGTEREYALIVAYVVAGTLAIGLGWAVFHSALARRIAALVWPAPAIAGVLDVAENLSLRAVSSCVDCDPADWWARAAQAMALTKFVLLVPALSVGVVAVAVTSWRLVRYGWDRRQPKPAVDLMSRLRSTSADSTQTLAWQANHYAPDVPPGSSGGERIGICVSGGGIRSAVVALGVLQALQVSGTLGKAKHLVSVSGGGYATGALRLGLQPHPDEAKAEGLRNVATPNDVFSAGSPEFAYLRRHGKYLADGALEWFIALGIVLRGLLANLVLIVLAAGVAGRLLGHFYAEIGLCLQPGRSSGTCGGPRIEATGFALAVVGLLLVATIAWVVKVWSESSPEWLEGRHRVIGAVQRTRPFLIGTVLLVFVIGFALPGLVELSGWTMAHLSPADPRTGLAQNAISTGAIASIAGYVATLAGIYWRKRTTVKQVADEIQRAATPHTTVPQRLVVYAGLGLFVGANLLVFAQAAAGAGKLAGPVTWTLPWVGADLSWLMQWQQTAVMLAVLLFLGTIPDQIRWSLHPFYRRRLASAFAIRRLRRPDGWVEAEAYDYDREATMLGEYAANRPGFPEVIFSAAAHVSGPDDAPPGRRVLPFTLSHDYVGGPGFGWIGTESLTKVVRPVIGEDLTVQSAMAVSGAAFASAMGRHSMPFRALFALTNARLGTWVPNPRYLEELNQQQHAWYLPRLPSRRRMLHLCREIFGRYCADDTMLLLSDGGHYENLGLVELLRRNCTTILCIDASGDDPALAESLAEAVTLAREELGVEIHLRGLDDLVAGSGAFGRERTGLIAALTPRLARGNTATGSVQYPRRDSETPQRTATIVLARATLTPDLPDDVLAYAARNLRFPSDPTSDQWFDHGQFDAYHALGRHVGEHLQAAYQTTRLEAQTQNQTPAEAGDGRAVSSGARPPG